MLNYKKIISLNPTVYDKLTNTLGQVIELVEHPVHGEEAMVVCICHELELADYSTFYETDDMMADHKEYEPSFVDGGYIGSCVDVGSGKKEVCKYFPDATIMAQYVGNPDENDWGKSKETTSEEFYKFVSKDDVPKKSISGNHSYHYISQDSYGKDMTIYDTAIYFIYNVDSDIHYFFKKTKYKNGGLTIKAPSQINKMPSFIAPNGERSNLMGIKENDENGRWVLKIIIVDRL